MIGRWQEWWCLTLVAWFQLGEFRLFSVGEISESGRGIALAILVGEELLERRKGCTCSRLSTSAGCTGEGELRATGSLEGLTGSEEAIANQYWASGAKAMVAMCYGGSMPLGIYTQEIATRVALAMWARLSNVMPKKYCGWRRRPTSMNVRGDVVLVVRIINRRPPINMLTVE